MLNLRPLDAAFPIERQLLAAATPVVLVNLFTVGEADVPARQVAWEKDANWMKRQAGYISTQLHRGIATGVAESAGGIVVDELIAKDPRRADCRLRCHLDASAEAS